MLKFVHTGRKKKNILGYNSGYTLKRLMERIDYQYAERGMLIPAGSQQ